MGDEKFLSKHLTACLALSIYIAVFVLGTEFLLLIDTLLLARSKVGIKVDAELSHFACVVKVHLMIGSVFVTPDTAVLQVIVWLSVCQQIIIIFAASLHVVVGILVESTERVVIIDLVVKAESSF